MNLYSRVEIILTCLMNSTVKPTNAVAMLEPGQLHRLTMDINQATTDMAIPIHVAQS